MRLPRRQRARKHRRHFGAKPEKKKKPAKADKTDAKKPAPEEKKEQTAKETIQAPYHFSPEETGQMNNELRIELQTIDNLEDQKKQANADFKLRIDGAKNKIKQLRLKLDSGQETRPLEAVVRFDTKRGKKQFHHPHSDAFIREEDMQPADWQLPMFKKEEVEGKAQKTALTAVPEPKPDKTAKAPATSPPGETNLGNVFDKAGAEAPANKVVLNLAQAEDDKWTAKKISSTFKKNAETAGWSTVQVSLITDRLKEADSTASMIDTLRPHCIAEPLQPGGDLPL